jgi:hypothetical protein
LTTDYKIIGFWHLVRHGARYPANPSSITEANEILYNLKESIVNTGYDGFLSLVSGIYGTGLINSFSLQK